MENIETSIVISASTGGSRPVLVLPPPRIDMYYARTSQHPTRTYNEVDEILLSGGVLLHITPPPPVNLPNAVPNAPPAINLLNTVPNAPPNDETMTGTTTQVCVFFLAHIIFFLHLGTGISGGMGDRWDRTKFINK